MKNWRDLGVAKRCSRGFTLIELIVAISVIAVLLALLLPAIQQAREAARRTQCRSQLKQIGLALHNYHGSFGTFPPGGITAGNWSTAPTYTNWAIAILPHLDQKPLYDRYDFTRANEDPVNAFVREASAAGMSCPSDPNGGLKGSPETGPGVGLLFATGSYRAMSGKSDGEPRPGGGEWYDAENSLPRQWRGAMHHVGTGGLRTERLDDVIDGASQTLLVGEYASKPCGADPVCNRTTFWAYTYTSYNQSSACPECGDRTMQPDYAGCLSGPGAGFNNACKRGWGSFHTGGVHFVLCDGSVRFINSNIDRTTFGNMATIAGSDLVRE
ncbi:MAG: DUF1559 domain-containing protein [Planctomycetales bacterium]